MQNSVTSDWIPTSNQSATPQNRSSDLLRRKTDSLRSLNFQNNILVQIYFQHIRTHGCEQTCQKNLPIIQELGDFLSKRGTLYVDAKPEELKTFLAWIQKKTHSKTIARQYAKTIIEFYLTLLQEGAIVTNPVFQLYPVLTNQVMLHKEEELDTPERIQLVEQISQYIGEQSTTPIGLSTPPRSQPQYTPRRIPSGELANPIQATASPRQVEIKPHFLKKIGFSFHRLTLYLLVIAVLVLFNHVAFVSTVWQWITQSTIESITNQPVPQNTTNSMRQHVFYANQISNTFCQTIMKVDCHANALPTNPLTPSWDNLVAGQVLFDRLCQECHGFQGKGGGPLANNMNPPPARLEFSGNGILHKDLYLFWTVYEGGTPTGSQMPAFKKILTEEELWQLVLFINSL